MAAEIEDLSRLPMSLRMRRARESHRNVPPEDRIQLLVTAELMTQDEADRAKRRHANRKRSKAE